MGVDFTILQGFGYVIPKNSLTEEELNLLYDLLEADDYFTFSIHGCYKETNESRIFIFLRDDVKTIAHMSGYEPNFEYNCQDFFVRAYYGEDEYHIKNFDPEPVEKEHAEFLADRRAEFDNYLEEKLPWLFERLIEKYWNHYEEWIFGYLS